MASIAPSTAEAELRRARADLESSLRAGTDKRAESLLATYTALAADTEAALELVYTEFVVRQELGQKPTPQEWYDRFPQLRTDLEQMFQVHDELCKSDASVPVWAKAPTLALNGGISRSAPRVPGYELQGELGRGGMGIVYKARHVKMNRTVALKVILSGAHAGAKERDRFQREVEAAAKLDHPNIVRIFEVGEHEGRPFCVMEFVEGKTLADRLSGTPWPIHLAVDIVTVLARAADHAHTRGIVHRDIKPANILLRGGTSPNVGNITTLETNAPTSTPQPLPLIPKLVDFGLAKHLDESGDPGPTRTGDVLGTPTYMAPEQAAGRAGGVRPGTDIWALGVILYELFAGRPPFQGDTQPETLDQVRTAEPVPPRRLRPTLPKDLQTICLKCLGKTPALRYATAAALADDLDRWRQGQPIVARPVGLPGRMRRWCGRNPLVAGLYATVATLFFMAVIAAVVAVANLADAHVQTKKVADHEWAARLKAEQDLMEEANRGTAERRRVVRLQIEEGARRLDEGDHTGAAVLFAAAYAGDPDPTAAEMHRIRLGTTLRACNRLQQSFWYGATLAPFRVSEDGSTLLRLSDEPKPSVWDTSTGRSQPIPVPDFPTSAGPVTLSSDGRTAVIVRKEKATAWDVRTGAAISLPLPKDRANLVHPFSPDGSRRLAEPSDKERNLVRILGINGELIGVPLDQEGRIHTYLFSPDGRRVATGGSNGVARVWDGWTGEWITSMPQPGAVATLAFSPNSSQLAVAGNDGTCQVWESTGERTVGPRCAFAGTIRSLMFDPTGRRLLLVGNLFAHSIDVLSGQMIGRVLIHGGDLQEGWYSPDGRTIGTRGSDGTTRVWDAETGHPVTPRLYRGYQGRHTDRGASVLSTVGDGGMRIWSATAAPPLSIPIPGVCEQGGEWSPDGTRITLTANLSAVIADPFTGKILHAIPHTSPVTASRFAPDNQRLATLTTDGVARLWNVATGQPVGEVFRHAIPIKAITFLPDGRLVTADGPGEVRVWDGPSGTSTNRSFQQGSPVQKLAATADGQRLLVVGREGKLWNPNDGRFLADVFDPTLGYHSELSPAGGYVASLTVDWKIQFVRTADGRPEPKWEVGTWLQQLAVSHNGRRVAAFRQQDGTVQIWDREAGTSITFTQTNRLRHVAFSPDSRLLATMTLEGMTRVWDAATGSPLTPPLEANDLNSCLAFSPDGRRLLTAGHDRVAKIWDLSPDVRSAEELMAFAQLLANRKLDANGRLVPLPRAEEQELWQRFKTTR